MVGFGRLKLLPWLMLFEAGRTLHSHLGEHLSPDDRRRVLEIVRRTKGDPRRVTSAERGDLRRIAAGLRVGTLTRDLVPALWRARKGGKRF